MDHRSHALSRAGQRILVMCMVVCTSIFLAACGGDSPLIVDDSVQTSRVAPVQSEETEDNTEAAEQTEETVKRPSKEEVMAMREAVEEGMSEEEISRITENIKVANSVLERAYLYEDLSKRLADPEDLAWNYIDQKGDIQVGWTLYGAPDYDASSGLTYGEYQEKYQEPVMTYNRFDADNFIDLMTEMRDSLKTELLKEDFDHLIDYTKLAKDTHDAEYINEIYHILHDMDYFLFRYGIEDVGKYVKDTSTVGKYYGALSVYSETE